MKYISFLLLLFSTATFSQQVELLKNLDVEYQGTFVNPGSNPTLLTKVGNNVFFVANDGAFGRELWKTDGTAKGTVLVKNINSLSASESASLFNFNGSLVFVAADPEHGRELWISDGTPEGTHIVADLTPGFADSHIANFAINGNNLLFFGTTGENLATFGLYKSDGTEEGTMLIKAVSLTSDAMVTIGKVTYFTVYGEYEKELWRTDGYSDGTVKIKEISPYDNKSFLTDVNGTLFFTALNDDYENVLWKSDGTEAETKPIKTFNYAGWVIEELIAYNDQLFFIGDDKELWKSDGSAEGTVIVKKINADNSSMVKSLTILNNGLSFTATDESGAGLFKTNGHESGTVKIAGTGSVNKLTAVNNLLYFTKNEDLGNELYSSDGTAGGTGLVKDINPNGNSTPNYLTSLNGSLLFSASDGVNGTELWMSDGTSESTVMLKNINAKQAEANTQGVYYNKLFIFVKSDPATGTEIWKSDGTVEGTTILKDINPGIGSSSPEPFTFFKNELYFVAFHPDTGYELWKTNGSESGTVIVKDINSGAGSSYPKVFTIFNDMLFFIADSNVYGAELWKTDGTTPGTVLLKDIKPGILTSNPSSLTVANNLLFFSAIVDDSGVELWKTNGYSEGTMLVKDINSNVEIVTSGGGYGGGQTTTTIPGNSLPTNLTALGNLLVFSATDGNHGIELWASDGSPGGTQMIQDITPGSLSSIPGGFTPFQNGDLVFRAYGQSSAQLWKTDGTVAGTTKLKDFDLLSSSTFKSIDGLVYFTPVTAATGSEPWVSNGTPDGTMQLVDAAPGSMSSYPEQYFNFNGTTYFFTSVQPYGASMKLWKTQGTIESTKSIAQFPIIGSTKPIIVNNELYIVGAVNSTPGLYKFDKETETLIPIYSSASSDANPYSFTVFNDKALYFLHNRNLLRIRAERNLNITPIGPLQVDEEVNLLTASPGFTDFVFSIVSGTASIQNTTLKATGSGTITVKAVFEGDATYSPLEKIFSIEVLDTNNKLPQTINFATLENKVYGDDPFVVNATGGASGNPIVFSIASGPATSSGMNGATISITGVGTVSVLASQAGAENYKAAPDVLMEFEVLQADQVITFPTINPVTFGVSPFVLTATGGKSTSDVTYSIVSGPASIVGSQITITGAGLVTVKASQAGDANYKAAEDATQQFTVAKAMATISFSNKIVRYDGAEKSIDIQVSPSELPTMITYNTSLAQPVNAGSYLVAVTINNPNYYGTATETFTVTKAPATIMMPDMSVVYNGLGQQMQASTSPAGITLNIKYNGVNQLPIHSGTYEVVANIDNQNYTAPEVKAILTIRKAVATIKFSGFTSTYNGSQQQIFTSTTPPNLAVNVIYNSSSAKPVNAGNYSVIATIQNNDYEGSEKADFTISKANATISIANQTYTYDGSPKNIVYTTSPENLATITKFNGIANQPVNAGSYSAVVAINDPNYASFEKTSILTISKAKATISLSDKIQTYDGQPKHVAVSSTPNALTTVTSYDGSSTLPVNAGTYHAASRIIDVNYEGETSETFTIEKANQKITVEAVTPKSILSNPFQLVAISSANLPITFTVKAGPGVISGNVLTLTGQEGTVVIEARQNGDINFLAAMETLSFVVERENILSSENPKTDDIETWPNPTSKTVMVRGNSTIDKIIMINNAGLVVFEKNPLAEECLIDVSNYSNGNYFMKIITRDQIKIRQITILR